MLKLVMVTLICGVLLAGLASFAFAQCSTDKKAHTQMEKAASCCCCRCDK